MAVRIVFCGSVQASVSEGESSGELVDVEEMGRCSTLPFWRKDTEFWLEAFYIQRISPNIEE